MISSFYQQLHRWFHHPLALRIARGLIPFRLWINIVLHTLLFVTSYLGAYLLLYGTGTVTEMAAGIPFTLVPLVLIQVFFFGYYDLFQGLWRYVSFEDLLNIIRASVLSTLAFYLIGTIWARFCMSEPMYLLDTVLCIVQVGGVRLVVRNIRENFLPRQADQSYRPIVLVGPLGDVQPVIRDFWSHAESRYLPVAVVDPLAGKRAGALRLNDLPVYSLQGAALSLRRFNDLHAAVFCWPKGSVRQMERVIDHLQDLQIPFMKLPRLEDIVAGDVSVNDIKQVELDDLLERPRVVTDLEGIQTYLKGKRVLVTGGGGSIGSELCRQIAAFQPRRLVILDRSENSLMPLLLELQQNFTELSIDGVIASVNDGPGLTQRMQSDRIQVVFHAAAYKHVPLMETAPVESAYNNILGTFNTARAALDAGVERFVMISTDKAVNPTNVMGVTKRIAEMIVQAFNRVNRTSFMTVRFGNVLGSAGSVIPIFTEQIERGGPVTVTDPEIERFFMTIPEAVQLVLQASYMGQGGEIFVLDMGASVRILHLAEKLITLSGKRPYEDIEIRFTGLRPGEKMYEELFNASEAHIATAHERIRAALCAPVDLEEMQAAVKELQRLIAGKDARGLRRRFQELVPSYQPENSLDVSASTAKVVPLVAKAAGAGGQTN
ncbi:MAG: nucleoside-diphosphate sugar epimerase/dehydratase [Desulfosarcinaceae bacterium]|nr:nucleoside-diphosphate sugar epimerase/dehydratase [Desulfosarcinaceae bacterium]